MKTNSNVDDIEEKYTNYMCGEADYLELNVEEAIFVLENDKKIYFVDEVLEASYEAILSDYKRVLKENEKLKTKYDKDTHKLQNDLDIANAKIIELEKKIEDLKDFRKKFVDITDLQVG